MNQRAKDGLYQVLEKTPVDGRSKVKMGTKVMEKTPEATTKYCYSCEEEGHLSRNCSKKQERSSTIVVGYQENEVRDLLALERPKKKKKKKQVYSKVMCFNCKKIVHYANKCLEKNDEADIQDSGKMDLNHVTCFKCKQKGHYSNKCTEKRTPGLQ
jgi:hypothetical protein